MTNLIEYTPELKRAVSIAQSFAKEDKFISSTDECIEAVRNRFKGFGAGHHLLSK